MATFNITISDASQLAGIKAARNAYNNSLPIEYVQENNTNKLDKDGKAIEIPLASRSGYLSTDQAYIQMVVTSAAISYANQFKVSDEAIAKMEADLAAAKAAKG